MAQNRKNVTLGVLTALAVAAVAPVAARNLDPDSQSGPQGLARLLAAEAKSPSAAMELRIGQLYGPGPADIGAGGQSKGSIGEGGIPVDYGRFMVWLRRAAHHCENAHTSIAEFQIGDLYAYGAGVKQDKVQALTWYLISTNMETSGLRGEYVDGMRDETTGAQQREAARRARNYIADARRRCAH